jgi:hypothetical protein
MFHVKHADPAMIFGRLTPSNRTLHSPGDPERPRRLQVARLHLTR